MKRLSVHSKSLPLILAVWAGGCGLAQGGQPIILPSDVSKPQPTPEAPPANQRFKPTQPLPTVNPQHIGGMSLPTPSARRKKTEQEKRRQAAQDERKNWLLLRPGELTDRSPADETFGLRQDDWLQDSDETEQRNYMFYGLDRAKRNDDRDGQPSQSRQSAAQTQPAPHRTEALTTEQQRKAASGNALLLYDNDRSAKGAHTAKELDLKGYLDTTIVDLRPSGQGQKTLEGPLRASAGSTRPPGQEARMQEFKRLLDMPKTPALASDANQAAKLPTQLPRAPGTPPRSLPETGSGLGSAGPLGAPADLSGAALSRSPSMPGLPDLRWGQPPAASRLSPAPPTRDPMAPPPISRPSVIRPTVLQIPSTR